LFNGRRRVLSFNFSRALVAASSRRPGIGEAEAERTMKTDLRPRTSEQPAATSKTPQPTRPAPPDAPETAPIHQTLTPEAAAVHATQVPRGAAAPQRRVTPAEFNTALVHLYPAL
jgi:hypothetical protein